MAKEFARARIDDLCDRLFQQRSNYRYCQSMVYCQIFAWHWELIRNWEGYRHG